MKREGNINSVGADAHTFAYSKELLSEIPPGMEAARKRALDIIEAFDRNRPESSSLFWARHVIARTYSDQPPSKKDFAEIKERALNTGENFQCMAGLSYAGDLYLKLYEALCQMEECAKEK